MKEKSPRRKLVIHISLYTIVIIIISILSYWLFYKEKPGNPIEITSTDAYTGDTIISVSNKIPEPDALKAGIPILGISNIFKEGVKKEQIEIFRNNIKEYSMVREDIGESKIEVISIKKGSYSVKKMDMGDSTVIFEVMLNQDKDLVYDIEAFLTENLLFMNIRKKNSDNIVYSTMNATHL